jgi:hypothetical protein
VETIESTYYEQEVIIEKTIDQLIIQDNGIVSSSNNSDNCSDSSECFVGRCIIKLA